MTLQFELNGKPVSVETEQPGHPLLWLLRDQLGLTGTKFGCGKAACGACTVHVDGMAVRSCSFAARYADGKQITTIEGLSREGELHPVQQAWLELGVPQCGYCQPGFMMSTAALLQEIPDPSDEDIDRSITNICRCGTYYRMRKAIHRAASLLRGDSTTQPSDHG